jgi:hypothetical protein
MTVQYSAFSVSSSVAWLYTRPAFGRQGRSVTENNFAKERRSWIAILLREVLQNALDAPVTEGLKTEVKIGVATLTEGDAPFIDWLIPPEHLERFKISVPHIKDPPKAVRRFLVIEDFGTTGLIGETKDPDVDGVGQNWNAFWFREGEGSKEHGAGNGGAGQGKITYFATSGIRTIFAYTVRSDDGCEALYGASSFLRDYEFGSGKWLRDSYWGLAKKVRDATIAVPSAEASLIKSFKEKFGVLRQAGQTGLSLVIPSPRDFDPKEAIEVIIAEFFTPILRGDLVVSVGDTRLDSETIMSLADAMLPDDRARELHTCTTAGYRAFIKAALEKSRLNEVETVVGVDTIAQLADASFTPEALARLREALDNEKQVAVRFPIAVKPRGGGQMTTHFDVHLMCPQDLDQVEQAIVRRDLLIGEEPIGGGSLRQRARGLTLINDLELSKLLLCAEEATHLRWNTRLPRLREYYKSGAEVVSYVRNAMAKLLDVLTGGDQKRDFKLLAKFFAAPGTASQIPSKGKKSPKGEKQKDTYDIPPPTPKKLVLQALPDGCRVLPNPSHPLSPDDLPVKATLEFAYEGLDKDAFAEYDPLDFDLADAGFIVTNVNCVIESRTLNVVEFSATAADFRLEVKGFDNNLRLRARLNYEEASNATTVDTE